MRFVISCTLHFSSTIFLLHTSVFSSHVSQSAFSPCIVWADTLHSKPQYQIIWVMCAHNVHFFDHQVWRLFSRILLLIAVSQWMARKSLRLQGSSRDDRVRDAILCAAVLPAGLLLLQLSLGQLGRVQELPWMAPAVRLPHGRSPLSVRHYYVWSRFGRLDAERTTVSWRRGDCYRGWWRWHHVPSDPSR